MKEQMTLSEKRKIADDFIRRTDPYHKKHPSVVIDLRAYAAYVEQNHIAPQNITDDMVLKFAK